MDVAFLLRILPDLLEGVEVTVALTSIALVGASVFTMFTANGYCGSSWNGTRSLMRAVAAGTPFDAARHACDQAPAMTFTAGWSLRRAARST